MSARLGAGTHVGLVGRWITATLEDGSTHLGVVHTVDPETGNMVLLRESSVRGLRPERALDTVIRLPLRVPCRMVPRTSCCRPCFFFMQFELCTPTVSLLARHSVWACELMGLWVNAEHCLPRRVQVHL